MLRRVVQYPLLVLALFTHSSLPIKRSYVDNNLRDRNYPQQLIWSAETLGIRAVGLTHLTLLTPALILFIFFLLPLSKQVLKLKHTLLPLSYMSSAGTLSPLNYWPARVCTHKMCSTGALLRSH